MLVVTAVTSLNMNLAKDVKNALSTLGMILLKGARHFVLVKAFQLLVQNTSIRKSSRLRKMYKGASRPRPEATEVMASVAFRRFQT